MKIIPLSEGAFSIDKTKLFVPFELGMDNLQNRPAGSLLVEIQPFVVVTSKDVLLLDTGLGFVQNGELQIYSNLKANQFDFSKITKVLITHLHKDHGGGVSIIDKLGQYSLTFPNAKYYIQKREVEYALKQGFPSYLPTEIEVLTSHPNVVLLEGDRGHIDNYITYELTGGHCPYHQVFWIRENAETIFFGGDVAPQLQQMKSKFVAKYDFDGKRCMELRQKWWQKGQEQHWTFLFYHGIKTPIWPTKE
ncbi:MAG: MBL fold metallo-hydrolase [Segetibacter sp.]|jgi:glyoxylase-like metal-dependent hydrolase (beta-lactamase superfamily II)|nr:MBL fold metallo-hydrolase [Segetibacter sp.]